MNAGVPFPCSEETTTAHSIELLESSPIPIPNPIFFL
jgi:hypothetical protein